jgi:hypothetical protein
VLVLAMAVPLLSTGSFDDIATVPRWADTVHVGRRMASQERHRVGSDGCRATHERSAAVSLVPTAPGRSEWIADPAKNGARCSAEPSEGAHTCLVQLPPRACRLLCLDHRILTPIHLTRIVPTGSKSGQVNQPVIMKSRAQVRSCYERKTPACGPLFVPNRMPRPLCAYFHHVAHRHLELVALRHAGQPELARRVVAASDKSTPGLTTSAVRSLRSRSTQVPAVPGGCPQGRRRETGWQGVRTVVRRPE